MSKDILRIGIAGLGTVGSGVVKILSDKADLLAARAGKEINVVAVSARNKKKKRDVSLSGVKWVDNPLDLARNKSIDVVVELIGGASGIAYELAKLALENKKSFVTANKALIAAKGDELAKIAEKNNVILAFEASVAGGIPVIGTIKNSLTANKINRVSGILNGTSNYILTTMQKDKRSFDDALKEAQELGYAEADPEFDIGGMDTAHKLAILSALAFGIKPDTQNMHVEGIKRISLADINYADTLGYKIKLLGVAENIAGKISQKVHPCLIIKESPIAQVDGVINAVSIDSDEVGPLLMEGPGAGSKPTASSVVGDIVDIAAGRKGYAFGIPQKQLKQAKFAQMDDRSGSYYIRLNVKDVPGVLAAVTSALSKEKIGVEQVLQPHSKDKLADIIITTHVTHEKSIKRALLAISKIGAVLELPNVIRIES